VSAVIRTRRYVSAPAGSYPAPKPPAPVDVRRASARVERAPAVSSSEESALNLEPMPEPPLVPASQPETRQPMPEPVVDEEEKEASVLDFGAPSEVEPPYEVAKNDEVTSSASVQGSRRSVTGVILGLIGGVAVGLLAGLLLLVFSLPERDYSRLGDVRGLWMSIDDPLVKASALLIAAGFLLLGIGLGSWTRRRS